MWHLDNTTLNLGPLTDLYIDFCLGHCKEILRDYKIKGGKTMWGYPHHCLQWFIRNGEQVCRHKFSKLEKAYLQDASAYLVDNGDFLWALYQKDPAYRKEIAESWVWINGLKDKYRFPPRNCFQLDLAFGAAECFMLLEEKNLL